MTHAELNTQRPGSSRPAAALTLTGEVIGFAAQLALVYFGVRILIESDELVELLLRFAWCVIAFVYLLVTVLGLNILVRFDQPDPVAARILIGHPLTRVLSTVITLVASLLGITMALNLLSDLGGGTNEPVSEFSAISAMLLSWALFNWGYARIYLSRYYREPEPPLVFPNTPQPRLVDFVYLAFTNATTFAVSDVQVVSSRMRWTLVWHTTLAFFFNAIIIALILNVVVNGSLFTDWID